MRFSGSLLSLTISLALPAFVFPVNVRASERGGQIPAFFIEQSPSHFLGEAAGMRPAFSPQGVDYRSGANQVAVRFQGARSRVQIRGEQAAGRANFLVGADARDWRRGLRAYRQIAYHEVYAGIDLVYGGSGGRFKSEFRVAPGADAGRILMRYSVTVSIAADGSLHAGELREKAPESYQVSAAGERIAINGRYRLIDAHTAGFEISAYDRARMLVIDPVVSYATYIGGSGLGAVTGVAVDSGGNLYAAGWTEAADFPIQGAVQATNLGNVDAFVVKLSPTGNSLIYATYIGGMAADRAAGIAVDGSGRAHVVGSTASINFPRLAAAQTLMGGLQTAFVLTLNAAGNGLVYSTYLGGTTSEAATAVAVDSAGNAYVAGDTQSSNFPVLHAPQPNFGGATDVFVAKLTAAGALSYATFLGGSGTDHAGGIAIDSSANVYVAGGTYSANFPVTAGAIQGTIGGGQDAFVAKLGTGGSPLIYSTYLGGNGAATPEEANGIAVDGSGNAYVAGVTNSANFPVTAGAYQTAFDGVSDAFVAEINPAGSALVYCSFLGGNDFDWASGIAVDSNGRAYVAGYTSSVNFPTVGGTQANFAGLYDAFVAEFGAAGSALTFATYIGGSGSDAAYGLALDASGNIYVGGQSNSSDLPLVGPLQSSNNGGSIGWLARLGAAAPPPQVPSAVSVSPSAGSGNAVTFTATYSDTGGAAVLTSVSLPVSASPATAASCAVSYNPSANVFTLANDDPNTGAQTVVPGGGTVQNSQCALTGAGSTASAAGNNQSIVVQLTFLAAFGGAKTLYLSAADSGTNTGWVSEGAWTVSAPGSQPSADTVSPNASTGASQTFTFVFSDSQSAANLSSLGVLFATSVRFNNTCYVTVNPVAGTIGLASDNGLSTSTRLLGAANLLQNSQCVVGPPRSAFQGVRTFSQSTLRLRERWAESRTFSWTAQAGRPIRAGYREAHTR